MMVRNKRSRTDIPSSRLMVVLLDFIVSFYGTMMNITAGFHTMSYSENVLNYPKIIDVVLN